MLSFGCSGGGGGDGGNDAPPTFTLSGTISVADYTAVDRDVNDSTGSEPISNNTADSAQPIPNPVILGGYVNLAGAGESGKSFDAGDPSDWYKVDLFSNQTMTLYIADPAPADLNLFLYDETDPLTPLATTLADSSDSRTKSITVPAAGSYYVEVRVAAGASNYNFSIAQSANSSGQDRLSLKSEFVAGEILVGFRQNGTVQVTAEDLRRKASALGLKVTSAAGLEPVLLKFSNENEKQVAFEKLGIFSKTDSAKTLAIGDAKMQAKFDTLQIIRALRQRGDIAYAEPNYIRHALLVPDDTHYSKQWHYPLIQLPEAWDVTTGSSSVIVAVIDTGVLLNHPDLAGQLTTGYDFISDVARANDGNGRDANPDDPGDETQGGSSFHGTHVAGTIAAASDNTRGVAGVGWDLKIMPLRALGVGGGTSADIIQALRYAAGLTNVSGSLPDQKADIINLSIGGPDSSAAEQAVFTQVREAGVIIVAAAGNEATSNPSYPAAYDGVVSVSAVDSNTQLAPYSNFGTSVDVAAPGGNTSRDLNNDGYPDGILSTVGNDSSGSVEYVYGFYQGTSMAAPHVAGVAGLMKALKTDLMPDDFDAFLTSGAITTDIGTTGKDSQFGYGLINAFQAVQAAASGTIPTVLTVSPASLNFGSTETSLNLAVQKTGQDALSIDTFSDDADWLAVTESSVSADGLGTYTISVDRDNISDGAYSATITFISTNNTIDVPVTMLKATSTSDNDAGFHYILLLDPTTFENLHQVAAAAQNGNYTFQLTGIPEGDYILYAGTDLDNDFAIGDAGEAAGAYLSLDQPVLLNVSNNRSGLDFSTGFSTDLTDVQTYRKTGAQPNLQNIRILRRRGE